MHNNNNCKYYEPIELHDIIARKDNLLSMFCINAQGLMSHWDSFCNLIHDMGAGNQFVDIIGITELFHMSKGECQLDGYHPLEFKTRSDLNSSRGGVGIYVKDSLSYEVREDLSVFIPHVFEAVFIEINIKNKHIIIGTVYWDLYCF